MTKYIDKNKIKEEIERRINGLKDCHADTIEGYAGEISGLERLLSFLDTLEVKEVDLEKEVNTYMTNEMKFLSDDVGYDTLSTIGRHFFELGLKAQKGE